MNLPDDASSDQSNCPPDYYRRTNGMLHQKPANNAPVALETPDITNIDSMTKDDLLNLIRTVAGAIWGYALMDDEQKADAARLKLYNMGMTATEVHKVVPALDKWFDRTAGKPAQSIAMTVKDEGLSKVSTAKLLRIAEMMDDDIIVIPPVPSVL